MQVGLCFNDVEKQTPACAFRFFLFLTLDISLDDKNKPQCFLKKHELCVILYNLYPLNRGVPTYALRVLLTASKCY